MAAKVALVSRISPQDFNNLPEVEEAWASINEQKNKDVKSEQDFRHLLDETIGSVILKHGAENEICAVLNHMHYKLVPGENQVTINPTPIKSNVDDVFIAEWLAKPARTNVDKDKLIPIKWRLNLDTGKLESYEYLIGNVENTEKYRKIAQEFENNAKLQDEIKDAINKTGHLSQYFGILLRYQPLDAACVELNWEKGRESKTTMFTGDSDKFKESKLYQELYGRTLIETSWIFHKVDDSKPQGKCRGHCGSHCNHCGHHCIMHTK